MVIPQSFQKIHYHRWLERENSSRENRFVLVMLIDVKASQNKQVRYTRGQISKAGNYGKIAKLNGDDLMTYRRMFTFADLTDQSGGCMVAFERNNSDAKNMWKYCQTSLRIGNIFAIMEPSSDAKWLGKQMPIIESLHPYYPLREIPDIVPEIGFGNPQLKTSHYFILKNCNLTIESATIVNTNCTGQLCDRRDVNITTNNCGCYHNLRNASQNHVMLMDITVFHAAAGDEFRIRDWSSLMFTQLFFEHDLPADTPTDNWDFTASIRQKLSQLLLHVNDHAGWTVVGWHRQGLVTDASETAAEDNQVLSDKISVHVVKLAPTELSKLALQQGNFIFDNADIPSAN